MKDLLACSNSYMLWRIQDYLLVRFGRNWGGLTMIFQPPSTIVKNSFSFVHIIYKIPIYIKATAFYCLSRLPIVLYPPWSQIKCWHQIICNLLLCMSLQNNFGCTYIHSNTHSISYIYSLKQHNLCVQKW